MLQSNVMVETMKNSNISIVIPVYNPPDLETFINKNIGELMVNQTIVIDSGGGEALRNVSSIYVQQKLSMLEARQLGYSLANEDYILNLDADMIIPLNFIPSAKKILQNNPNVGAVSLLHRKNGKMIVHLTFGCSLWKKELLQKFYDYNPQKIADNNQVICVNPSSENKKYVIVDCPFHCECVYMWSQLAFNGYSVEFIPEIPIATHLK